MDQHNIEVYNTKISLVYRKKLNRCLNIMSCVICHSILKMLSTVSTMFLTTNFVCGVV